VVVDDGSRVPTIGHGDEGEDDEGQTTPFPATTTTRGGGIGFRVIEGMEVERRIHLKCITGEQQ